jgi:hypothetical protein
MPYPRDACLIAQNNNQHWIPAFAGMTGKGNPAQNHHGLTPHYDEGLRCAIGKFIYTCKVLMGDAGSPYVRFLKPPREQK